MAATLDYHSFAKELNTSFKIQISPDQTVEAELTNISEHLVSEVQDQFSVIFRTSNDVFLRQGIRDFHHERMGDFKLFISPIGRDDNGTSYEAVFNNIIKKT